MKSPAILSAHNIMKEIRKNQDKHLPEQNIQTLDESLYPSLTARFLDRICKVWSRFMTKA